MNKTICVNVELSPEDLAQAFCDMGEDEQAIFFNEIHRIVAKDWTTPFEFQLDAITKNPCLTKAGREIMKSIGEYSSQYVDYYNKD